MFELRQELGFIQSNREQIVAIIESINQPMVAASGKPLETTKAYIIGMRNASGLFSIYIYLHLLDSNDCLIYLHDPSEIPMGESYHDVELEALGFVESMGFMLENLNFRNLSPEDQEEAITSSPVFHSDLSAFARPSEISGESTESLDLSPLKSNVLELEEVAEEISQTDTQAIPKEGLAKIVRLLSSF